LIDNNAEINLFFFFSFYRAITRVVMIFKLIK